MKRNLTAILKAIKKIDLLGLSKSKASVKVCGAVVDALRKKKSAIVKHGHEYKIWTGECYEYFPDEEIRLFLRKSAVAVGMLEDVSLEAQVQEQLYCQFVHMPWNEYFPLDMERRMRELLVGFLNGYAVVSRGGVTFHAPNRDIIPTISLPIKYDPLAKSPIFDSFLAFAFPDIDTRNTVLQMLAHTMIPFKHKEYVKLDKALFLVGPADTGKSVLLDVFKAVLGRENYESVHLSDLANPDSFEIAQLEGKVAVFCSDTDISMVDPINLKNFISGEAPNARVKHNKNSIRMLNYAKPIVASNDFPVIESDHKEPIYKRLLFVPMRHRVSAKDMDRDLTSKIVENELSGMVNYILEAMAVLISQRNITGSLEITREKTLAMASGLHVDDLIRDGVLDYSDEYTPMSEIYGVYLAYCGSHRFTCHVATSTQQFHRAMKATDFLEKRINNQIHYACKIRYGSE